MKVMRRTPAAKSKVGKTGSTYGQVSGLKGSLFPLSPFSELLVRNIIGRINLRNILVDQLQICPKELFIHIIWPESVFLKYEFSKDVFVGRLIDYAFFRNITSKENFENVTRENSLLLLMPLWFYIKPDKFDKSFEIDHEN